MTKKKNSTKTFAINYLSKSGFWNVQCEIWWLWIYDCRTQIFFLKTIEGVPTIDKRKTDAPIFSISDRGIQPFEYSSKGFIRVRYLKKQPTWSSWTETEVVRNNPKHQIWATITSTGYHSFLHLYTKTHIFCTHIENNDRSLCKSEDCVLILHEALEPVSQLY